MGAFSSSAQIFHILLGSLLCRKDFGDLNADTR
jgi:hypothetical protein